MYDDYDDDDGFACGGRNAYDMNGYTVCDCYECMKEFSRSERRRKKDEIQRNTDWSKFPMQITLKRDGKCADCKAPQPQGSVVMWDGPATGVVRCVPGSCRPKGWANHAPECKHCGEPYSGESGGYGYDGDYDHVSAHYGCGSREESRVFHRSSGCRTIERLRKNEDPSTRVAGGGVVNLLDLQQ